MQRNVIDVENCMSSTILKTIEKNPNGIMVLNLDSQRRYFTHNALDLCPDCMKGFQDWFGEVK